MKRLTVLLMAFGAFAGNARALSDTSFTYQGELKQNGNLATGVFDMIFSLWDAPVGGTQVGPTINNPGTTVTEGRFTVQLDMGAGAFDNSSRWLQITVDGFTLSPRQPITRSPYSIQTRGIFVDDNSNVGIGTTSPAFPLHILADQPYTEYEDTAGGSSWLVGVQAPSVGFNIQEVGAAARLVINEGGHVGIGTTAPQANLHIDGASSTANGLLVHAPGASTGDVVIGSPAGHVGITGLANNGNRRDIRFMNEGLGLFTRNSPSAPVTGNGLFISESGNVGIGTTSPNSSVQVVGNGGNSVMRLTNGGGGGQTNTGLIVGDVIGSGRAASFYGLTSNTLVSIVNDGSGKAAAFGGDVTILGGDVGVGASAPIAKLHVDGGTDASPAGGGYIVVGNTAGINVAIDSNEIMARSGGGTSRLFLNNNGGDVVCGGSLDIGYVIVSAPSSVSCPAGTKVLGGGCRISGNAEIRASYPSNTSWICEAGDQVGFVTLTAYAICADVK